jgi:hypothetical protein
MGEVATMLRSKMEVVDAIQKKAKVAKKQSPRERPRERRPEKLAERHPRNLF